MNRGTAATGRGRSIRATARSATCFGVSSFPPKEAEAQKSSVRSCSIGVQMPDGHRHEMSMPRSPDRPQLPEQGQAERQRGVLRRAVGRHPRHRRESGERDDVDHGAGALRAHLLQRGQRPVHRAEGVDLEHGPLPVELELPARTRQQDPGVVDPDVEAAVFGDGRLRERGAGRRVPDVERDRVHDVVAVVGATGRRGVEVGRDDGVAAPAAAAGRSRSRGHERRP